jgi:hypothetical protein
MTDFEFEILMEVNTILWDVTPCDLIEDYRSLRGKYYLHLQGRRVRQATSKKQVANRALVDGCLLSFFVYPEDGGSTFFRNVVLPHCMAS